MILAISSKSIGSKKNLIYNGDEWMWSNTTPDDAILWGFDSPRDFSEAVRCLRETPISFHDTPWGRAHESVQDDISLTPWRMCVPRDAWKDIVLNLVDQLWMLLTDESNRYYVSTHMRNRELLWKLERPIVCGNEVRKCCAKLSAGVKSNLEKFLPLEDGHAARSTYSFSSTVTGRMTITKGPNILTARKDKRHIIKSRYKDGKIVEIDLQSIEPRVALALFGKSVSGDIYSHVMKKIEVDITRPAAKIATLSALYGASHHALKSRLPQGTNSLIVLESVKDYFGVHHIEKMVQEQHREKGLITNTHGRKIFSDVPSVNHLIQSSAVDVAFDVFELLLLSIESEKIKAHPLYLIHDAIIIDIREHDLEKLHTICEEGFTSSVVKTKFPVRISEIA